MSASEKLNALMTGYMDRVQAVGAGYADAWLITAFHQAHPQIVAVVEEHEALIEWAIGADEQLDQEFGTGSYTRADEITRAASALAALEEVLP